MLKTINYKAKNVLILSDIHGNYSALNSVFKNIDWDCIKGMILLGDLIDYGPSSNEAIELLKKFEEIKKDDVVILSGSVPNSISKSIYADIIKLLPKDCKVILDNRE